jgi:hypothetical protein
LLVNEFDTFTRRDGFLGAPGLDELRIDDVADTDGCRDDVAVSDGL